MKPVATRLGLWLILLAAFGLRTWRLDFQELRGDEVFGYFFSQRGLTDLAPATIALKEPHPIGSYVLQHGWLQWAGDSEFALRFVTVWFGVAAVALLFRLARSLALAPAAAMMAAFSLAVSPYAVWHSQDARMYTMSLSLTLVSNWLGVVWLLRRHWRWAAGYIAVSWLALHVHYFAVFVLLAQLFFVIGYALVQPRLRFLLRDAIIGQVFIALLYLPWYLQVSAVIRTYDGNGDSPSFMAMLWRSMSVFAVGESMPLAQRPWWALLAGLVVLVGGWQLWRGNAWKNLDTAQTDGAAPRRLLVQKSAWSHPHSRPQLNPRGTLWFLALYLFFPLLATWWSSIQRPIFNERYLIAAAPPFYLLAGALFEFRIPQLKFGGWLARCLLPLLLFIVLVTGMAFSLQRHYSDPAYSKTRGWRDLASAIQQFASGLAPEQVWIAQNFPDPTLWYYYRGPLQHIVVPPAPHDVQGAQAAGAQLAAAGVDRLILPLQPAPNWDDQGIAAAALATHYDLLAEKPVGVWPVQVYTRRLGGSVDDNNPQLTQIEKNLRESVKSADRLEWQFENGVLLNAASVQPTTLAGGGLLAVYLVWTRTEAPMVNNGELKVFVQLLNPTGQLVSQQDRGLDFQTLTAIPTHVEVYGLLLPDELPPGVYHLITGLYQPTLAGAPRVLLKNKANFVTLIELEAVDD